MLLLFMLLLVSRSRSISHIETNVVILVEFAKAIENEKLAVDNCFYISPTLS